MIKNSVILFIIVVETNYSDIFPSNASKSPEIEPETDVSENKENLEISTPDHEETDDEEVEMTNNKEAKENKDEHKDMTMKKMTKWIISLKKSDKCNETDIEENETVHELHDDLDTSDHEETADEEEEVVETTDNKKVKENKTIQAERGTPTDC
ncbi:hypothetical protein GLOIN_2v1765271 [Rhizophagus irregularis DAOM 181602=DAOM 197198]|nr:hypothetical protein GLOIN_2v1765271 [Rhizophagus irregularis DAOM 181602=DAOM 197198]